jgi:stage V sporulation protein B
MKKQSIAKATAVLGIAGIFAKFLGIFFRWPLIMLIGDEGIGYYQMSYPLYMFFIAMASGIPVAISKMVSERNATNNKEEAILVLRQAIFLMLVMGVAFTLFIYCFSRQITITLKWDQKAYYSLLAIALAPLFICIVGSFRGFFQGQQNMNPTAISQIIEQLGRVVVGVTLAYILLPKGIEYAAGGAAFGAVAGAFFSSIYLIITFYSKKFSLAINIKEKWMIGKLLYIAIPISIGAAVSSVMGLIDSIIVPQKLLIAGFSQREATMLYGQLTGKAFVLVNVPLTLSIALCASIVPIISEAFILDKLEEVHKKTQMAIGVSMVIALPSCFGLYFMSYQVLNLIFPGHGDGYNILKYLSIAIPFIILAQTCTAILQGIGRYSIPVKNLFFGCFVKIVITLILVSVPNINIYGAVIGTIFGYGTAAVLNLLRVKKILKLKLNIHEVIIKPAYASVIMIISVVILFANVYNITKSNGISCLISISAGIAIYIAFTFVFGIFDYTRVKSRIKKKNIYKEH